MTIVCIILGNVGACLRADWCASTSSPHEYRCITGSIHGFRGMARCMSVVCSGPIELAAFLRSDLAIVQDHTNPKGSPA